MIEVSVEPTRLVAGRRTQLTIRFANTGRRQCSDLVFQLRLPSAIKLMSGRSRADIATILPGRQRTHEVTVEPTVPGDFELTSSNFSYSDETDRPVRVNDFLVHLKVEAAPAPAEIRRPLARLRVESPGGALTLGEWNSLRILLRNTTGVTLTNVTMRISGPLKSDGKLPRVPVLGAGAAARFPFNVYAGEGGQHVPVSVHTTYSYPAGGSVHSLEQDDRIEVVVARPAEPDAHRVTAAAPQARPGSPATMVFEVAIRPGSASGTYAVEVVHSPAGEGSSTVEFPVHDIVARRWELQQMLRASATGTQGSAAEIEPMVREIGLALFTALLGTGEVASLYRASTALSASREQGLRVLLRIDTPQLASLPWEAMYDGANGRYVCRQAPVVRHLPVQAVTRPLSVRPPLRILAVVSSPEGLSKIDADRERQLLDIALAPLSADGLVDITWAPKATWDGLHDLLMSAKWHVVHFIGHGSSSPHAGEGSIALTDDNGQPHPVDASRFADLLLRAQPEPRLVVLNSCAGAATGRANLFGATAGTLVRAGVTAVAAMQFIISDTAALAFTRGFYSAIARGRGVDDAMSAGRVAILGTSTSTLEWLTPVLFLRGNDAQLFSPA